MGDLEGGGEFPVDTSKDVIENYGAVEDVPAPVLMWHLILFEVHAGYFNESAPGAFDETVGAMSFGGGCNDTGLVVVDQ